MAADPRHHHVTRTELSRSMPRLQNPFSHCRISGRESSSASEVYMTLGAADAISPELSDSHKNGLRRLRCGEAPHFCERHGQHTPSNHYHAHALPERSRLTRV